ncbi:hypothetical protein Tco_0109096 [Tanacetum coccineum]
MAFPRLQELAVVENSNNLTDAMNINDDLQFAAGLSNLWEVLYSMVHEHRLLIAELNVFGGLLALQYEDDDVGLYLLWFYVHGDDDDDDVWTITMAQDNGYAFVEVQEDGTKTICIDYWFEAEPGHGMSFDKRPIPDR